MFKSWIRDLGEAYEKKPNTEVGTDEYRNYAMKMTGTKSIKNFINKYKKKS